VLKPNADVCPLAKGLHLMLGNKQEVVLTLERLLAATIKFKGEEHEDVARVWKFINIIIIVVIIIMIIIITK
jgi:hypothetical protein